MITLVIDSSHQLLICLYSRHSYQNSVLERHVAGRMRTPGYPLPLVSHEFRVLNVSHTAFRVVLSSWLVFPLVLGNWEQCMQSYRSNSMQSQMYRTRWALLWRTIWSNDVTWGTQGETSETVLFLGPFAILRKRWHSCCDDSRGLGLVSRESSVGSREERHSN